MAHHPQDLQTTMPVSLMMISWSGSCPEAAQTLCLDPCVRVCFRNQPTETKFQPLQVVTFHSLQCRYLILAFPPCQTQAQIRNQLAREFQVLLQNRCNFNFYLIDPAFFLSHSIHLTSSLTYCRLSCSISLLETEAFSMGWAWTKDFKSTKIETDRIQIGWLGAVRVRKCSISCYFLSESSNSLAKT